MGSATLTTVPGRREQLWHRRRKQDLESQQTKLKIFKGWLKNKQTKTWEATKCYLYSLLFWELLWLPWPTIWKEVSWNNGDVYRHVNTGENLAIDKELLATKARRRKLSFFQGRAPFLRPVQSGKPWNPVHTNNINKLNRFYLYRYVNICIHVTTMKRKKLST